MINISRLKSHLIALGMFCLWSSIAIAGDLEKSLLEVNERFTYQGKPIHPGLVQEFQGWLSDSGKSITVSVDVAAAFNTNEYFDDAVKVKDNGCIFIEKEETREYFYYKWLGKLNSGLHVLEVGAGGEGSGVFKDVLIIKFEIGKGLTPDGKAYDRLLMSIVGNYILGDRDTGEIQVFPDKVVVGKSQYRKNDVTLFF